MTTSNIALTNTAYTAVAGPGAVGATLSFSRTVQVVFSDSQPAASVVGHHVETVFSVPLATMGSGIYCWAKTEIDALAVAVVTLQTDAQISNGTGGGGGSGSGGDASAANQTAVQANAGSNASKAEAVQGITGGKPISSSIDQTTPGTTDAVTVKASAGIGSLTETAPASDTASSGLNGRLQRVAQRITSLIGLFPSSLGQAAMAASFSTTIASDQSTLPVKEIPFKVTQNFTRPSNTTTYVIGQAISNATSSPTQVTFSAVGAANQFVLIRKVLITSSQKGSPLLQAMVYMYGATLALATFNDGATLDIDQTTYETGGAAIPCVETSSVSSRARSSATGLNIPLKLDSSGNMYSVLQALNAYVPANGEKITLTVWGILQ